MPDYGHELMFGVGLAPNAGEHQAVLATAELADDLGHEGTAGVLAEIDAALVAMVEEDSLLEPIGRLAIRI